MVTKTSDIREIRKALKVRSVILGSAAAVLMVSAVAGSAHAAPISIQTLGGEAGTELPVGSINAQRLRNPFAQTLVPTGQEDDDTVDKAQNEGPTTEFVDTQDPNNPVPGIGTQATSVPEPGVLGLFGAGLLALGLIRRRRG